jgi:hypothetical protein
VVLDGGGVAVFEEVGGVDGAGEGSGVDIDTVTETEIDDTTDVFSDEGTTCVSSHVVDFSFAVVGKPGPKSREVWVA